MNYLKFQSWNTRETQFQKERTKELPGELDFTLKNSTPTTAHVRAHAQIHASNANHSRVRAHACTRARVIQVLVCVYNTSTRVCNTSTRVYNTSTTRVWIKLQLTSTVITRYYPIMCSTPKISCRYQTVPETLSTTHSDYYNTRSI